MKMPNKNVNDIYIRLSDLEAKVDQHLKDGVVVLQNIATLKEGSDWIKRAIWVVVAASLTTAGTVITALLTYLLNRK